MTTRRRSAPMLALGALLAACGGSSSDDGASDATTDGAIDATIDVRLETNDATATETTTDADAAPPPHVDVHDGALFIDGAPTFLYGGDLHYFRVRDPAMDATKTQAMWAQTLDTMHAAGMNLVTTYAPWDWHETSDGVYDFSGARDLGKFLSMICDRKMWVVLKPGPNITGEWPRGFGTYGAVPEWWKSAHPEALVKNAKGATWSYSPTGDASQSQAIYLHPTYLAAVHDWYAHVLEVARPYLGKCLVGLQVDNETNGYWGSRFGDVDYSDTSVAWWRGWLKTRYATVADLNAKYGTTYASFDEVAPPTSAPGSGTGERANDRGYADWFEGGQAYSGAYLKTLRDDMTSLGFSPPNVLFLTNDSPFPLVAPGGITLRPVLLHDGPTKEAIGTCGLDLYPKQDPTNDHLQDQPFQADYFTKLYDFQGGKSWAYAAELQGGFYALPVVGHPDVKPEATDQILARSIGRGLKGGSFYVVRDGINADGGAYDYLAAIAADGSTTPRYDVMKKWGAFLASYGTQLLGAKEITNDVVVVTNARYLAPQGGLLDDMQRFSTIEESGIFGWLAAAGIDADVVDARGLSSGALAEYKVAFYQNPDFVDDATATLLNEYVAHGGVLVDLLWPGRTNDDFASSAPTTRLSTVIFPGVDDGYWVWPTTSRSGDFHVKTSEYDGLMTSFWYESFWKPPAGGALDAFAFEHTALGSDGKIVGYARSDADGHRAFLGTNVWGRFAQDGYYSESPDALAHAESLALHLCALGGERPILSTGQPRQIAWARRNGDVVFVFVVNDDAAGAKVHVAIDDAARLGLDPSKSYASHDALNGGPTTTKGGADLAASGFDVDVAALSTAVVVLEAK